MIAFFRWLFRWPRSPRCPVCDCRNWTETPFEGRTDQGVIGYDRTFACGFRTHWRGYRTALCSAEHPVPLDQAIAQIAEAARPRPQLVNNHG